MKLFYSLLLMPFLLFADAVFEINEKEYRTLDSIALQVDPYLQCGKGSNGHNYTEIYSFYFSHLRNRPLKILEIGIFKGVSIKLWENYFINADLHFIDITFQHLEYFSERSKYYLADQANPDQLKSVMKQIGEPLDIIIDDGGHTMNQQITSFVTLWPYLKSGGIYVIEDLHTSYWKSYSGNEYGGSGTLEKPNAGPNTTIQFLKNLIDDVNFIGARTALASSRKDLSNINHELNTYRKDILGIHFYDSLCFIIKR